MICDEYAVTQMGADSFTYAANGNQAHAQRGSISTLRYDEVKLLFTMGAERYPYFMSPTIPRWYSGQAHRFTGQRLGCIFTEIELAKRDMKIIRVRTVNALLGFRLRLQPNLLFLSHHGAEAEERAGIIISRVKKEFNLNHSTLEDISYAKEKRRFVNFPPNSSFPRGAPGPSRRAVLGEEG